MSILSAQTQPRWHDQQQQQQDTQPRWKDQQQQQHNNNNNNNQDLSQVNVFVYLSLCTYIPVIAF